MAVVAGLTLVLGACTGDDEPEVTEPEADARLLEHRFGETELAGVPERVVSLGPTDADALLALGVVPVAVRAPDAPGVDDEPVGPWALDRLDGSRPRVLSDGEIDPDEIAALRPDLIVAVSDDVDRATYDRLTAIAPTVVRPAGYPDGDVPWTVSTTLIGDAVGNAETAAAVVAETEELLAEVRASNPRLDGATATVVRPSGGRGFDAFMSSDAHGQLMSALGLQLPPALAAQDTGAGAYVNVPLSRRTDLEADVVVALDGGTGDEALAPLEPLAVAQRGAVIEVEPGGLSAALARTSVLSIPYAVDRLVPSLAQALA